VLWGPAVDGERIYAANAFTDPANPASSEGMTAIDLATGRKAWTAKPPACNDRKPCKPTLPGAVTAIPGVVFSGTMDGRWIAYASSDGSVLWQFDAVREFETVNGVKGAGGSISNGGAVVVDGMLYANSGYSHHGGVVPGNVLLAFGVE
jgi:polyvinyl alcohol dehydrogenase (cytochrome)